MSYALWRLAIGRRGKNLGHLLGVIVGLTIALLVLLGAVALSNALTTQVQLTYMRDGSGYVQDVPTNVPHSKTSLLRSSTIVPTVNGSLTITTLAKQGSNPAKFLSLSDLPPVGSVLVSPALADALSTGDERAAMLRSWLPSDPTGVLDNALIASPTELVALVIASPEQLQSTGRFEEISVTAAYERSVSRSSLFSILLSVVAILVPVASLIAVAVRLSATRRDERYATLRLIGATPRDVRILVAFEAAAAALLAYLVAVLLALLVRVSTTQLTFAGNVVFTRDLRVSLVQHLIVLVAVVGLACMVAVLATRRLDLTPLQVRRRTRHSELRWTRSLWLPTGLGILVSTLLARSYLPELVLAISELVGISLIIIGLVRWTPLLVRTLSRGIAVTPASTLAARRLQFDPQVGLRVVIGLALGAFAFGFLQVIGPGVGDAQATPTRADIVIQMQDARAPQLPDMVRQIPGVISSIPIRRHVAVAPDHQPQLMTIGDCKELLDTFNVQLITGTCGIGNAIVPSSFARLYGANVGTRVEFGLRGSSPRAALSPWQLVVGGIYESDFSGQLGLLVDGQVEFGTLHEVHVMTDGYGATTQQVFATVARIAPGAVATTPETQYLASVRDIVNTQRAINSTLVGAIIIGIAAFAYGVVGMILDRRPLLKMLRTLGMQPSGLAVLLAVELGVPLLAASGTSLLVGTMVGATFAGIVGNEIVIPFKAIAEFLVIIIVATLLALLVLTGYVSRLTTTLPQRTM
jgi:ABC-type lipoprotein release transport system permease subunit